MFRSRAVHNALIDKFGLQQRPTEIIDQFDDLLQRGDWATLFGPPHFTASTTNAVRRRAAIPEKQTGSAHSVAEPLTRIEAPRIAGAFRRCGWEAGIDPSKCRLTSFGSEHTS